MESDNSEPKLAAKCTYVVTCRECGYKECYDHLALAESAASKHSRWKGHIAVSAYDR